ncbi:MAG: O-antigen ligase family protein [Gemmataceae bacterium]|nr:O-antigen ligase family protein [Gemmataceae bacterium]
MDFALFVLLNAVLLIRPDDLVPELAGLRTYLFVIGLTLVAAAPRLVDTLRPADLAGRPIACGVIGFWAAGIVSQIARGQFGLASDFAGEFGKVVLYYLLLVSVVDSPARLRAFLGWLVVLVGVLATLGLLQFYGAIDVEALRPIQDRMEVDPATGELLQFNQLRANGMFNDPNDLCLILTVGVMAALYRAAAAGPVGWAVWLPPAGVFVFGVMLTQSRGGLLALMAAGGGFLAARYGWRRALPLALAGFPVVVVLFAGRQTNFDDGGNGTANQRMQFWSEGFTLLFGSTAGPQTLLTGIGVDEFAENIKHVAHNSFVHAYVETGLLGGGLFAALFALAVWGVYRAGGPGRPATALAAVRPYLFGMVFGYAAGVFSLSRNYVIPTYLVLGLATAYLSLAGRPDDLGARLSGRLLAALAVLALAALVGLVMFTRAFVQFGGGP